MDIKLIVVILIISKHYLNQDHILLLPDVKVHEGLEAGDVVWDALDGVVVEEQPLQTPVSCAF